MTDDLRVRLHTSSHGPVVCLSGRLSASTMETFLRVAAAALRIREARTLSVELGQVGYIDVAGVAALLECRRLTRILGREFILTRVSDQVRAALRACAASSLLATRLQPRCGIRRRHRPPLPIGERRRLFCGHVSRTHPSTFRRAEPA